MTTNDDDQTRVDRDAQAPLRQDLPRPAEGYCVHCGLPRRAHLRAADFNVFALGDGLLVCPTSAYAERPSTNAVDPHAQPRER